MSFHSPQPLTAFRPSTNVSLKTVTGGAGLGVQNERDRRRETRYPCRENADVRVLSGELGPLPALISDMSRSGLRLELGVALPQGRAIAVVLQKDVIVYGQIRYCRLSGATFQAGVRIEDVFYANHGGGAGHVHEHQLTLYLLKNGSTAAETFRVRDHLQRCELCAARYKDALRQQEEQRRK